MNMKKEKFNKSKKRKKSLLKKRKTKNKFLDLKKLFGGWGIIFEKSQQKGGGWGSSDRELSGKYYQYGGSWSSSFFDFY